MPLYKVTVGLCVKNMEDTVPEAIGGIANQDFNHKLMELIVVDDGSVDRTMPIIREQMAKTDITCKIIISSRGLGYNRQVVVNNASGEYIVWVDGDIILSPNYISQQVDFMDHNLHAGIAQGVFGFLNDDNAVATLENICYVIDSRRHLGKVTSGLVGTGGSIFRVEALRTANFDAGIKGAQEDVDVAYKIKMAGWEQCNCGVGCSWGSAQLLKV